jgi:hypothetical protein
MNHRIRISIIVFIVLLSASILVGAVQAHPNAGYAWQQFIISSASHTVLQGNGYGLNAKVGQPVVGQSSGSGYEIVSGDTSNYSTTRKIYLPLVTK